MKVTKKQRREFLRKKLTEPRWATRALLTIYGYQTNEEQETEHTRIINDMGFTGVDGNILTSFAKQFLNKGYLSPKQMEIVTKKMPKYHRQIMGTTNLEKLDRMIMNASTI